MARGLHAAARPCRESIHDHLVKGSQGMYRTRRIIAAIAALAGSTAVAAAIAAGPASVPAASEAGPACAAAAYSPCF